MAYFNHAYKKSFLAVVGDRQVNVENSPLRDDELPLPNDIEIKLGVLDTDGVHISYLKEPELGMGPGVVGFFKATEKDKDLSVRPGVLAADCCPFYVAGAAIKTKDKQGPYHGGYREPARSKVINPKYTRKTWGVVPNAASQAVLEIGGTADNIAANPACAKEFICGEDYNLRIDIKGTPALRFANHNLYHTFQANGGCCADPTLPAAVGPETIYTQWATQIAESEFTKDFVLPLVEVTYDDPANPGTPVTNTYAYDKASALAAGLPAVNILSAIDALTAIESAGLILLGAYVDTKFGDCTFQVSDFYGQDPVQLFASEVDYNGDPCAFEGLCVTDVCLGIKAEGLGESVVRDVILSESYLQNFFSTDERIREITQGTAVFDLVDRTALYSRTYILHSVPRFNNPTGVFDNDQYLLEIIGDGDTVKFLADALNDWTANCAVSCDEHKLFIVEPCEFDPKFVTPKV